VGTPPDSAPPDVPPADPPSLTRCTVYEHAGPCTLTPTTDGVGVWDVVFSPDGRYLLTGGDDGRVKVWQVTPGGLVDDNRAFAGGPKNGSVHMAFSADGTRLAVGGGDGTVAVYEFPKMSRLATLMGHPGGINYLAFSADGSRLVSVDNALTVKLWDLAAAKEQRTLTLSTDWHSVALSPGGQPASLWLAVSHDSGRGFTLMDLAADPVPLIPVDAGMEVYGLAFSPDGQELAVGTADGKMTLWDASTKTRAVAGPILWPASGTPGNAVIATKAVFSGDGRFVAASGSLSMYSAGNIKMATVQPPGLRASTVTDSSAMSLDFSRDGRAIAAGSWRCGKITFCRD
jgi:WD40 repeat protein